MSAKNYTIILWSSVIAALALVAGGMFWIVSQGPGAINANIPGPAEAVEGDNVLGNPEAKVTLIEYSDFQCPYCAIFYKDVLKQIESEYEDRVLFVYRNFPIPGHTNGPPAAYAAEAAGLQGKFWEMADIILTRQTEWTEQNSATFAKTLDSYAQSLGLDMAKFNSDKNSSAVRAKVETDYQSGIKAGVSGTPTVFLNGQQVELTNYDGFKRTIDDALAANQ